MFFYIYESILSGTYPHYFKESHTYCSFSLFAQRKRTKRKDTFSKVFFIPNNRDENRPLKANFYPRFQKILTLFMAYTGEKE
jgi:hypothetical protein